MKTPAAILLISAIGTGTAIAADEAFVNIRLADPARGMDAEVDIDKEDPYGNGLRIASGDERFSIHAWLRAQFRYTDPFASDPRTPAAFDEVPGNDTEIRRGRIKVEGQLGSPALSFYYEQELTGDRPVLDLRLDAEFGNAWHLRAGQYKVLYNRERVDSSGKQTFVERSISTYAFTLDRQRGIAVTRHFAAGSRRDQKLMLGIYEGDSRDPGPRGNGPMLIARWQWNFLGEDLPFSQSDLKFRDAPAASFALAAATVEGPYTRFSSSGGGQLDGFEQGSDERYELRQWLEEFALHYDGYSIQQEYHVKRIEDQDFGGTSTLRGGYLQAAKAWQTNWFGPENPFELAVRVASVDWEDTPADREQHEITLGANLFFEGHDNKLTIDISRLELDYVGADSRADTRLRLQWDVSF
jgi:phosphate-selective porin OprO/OprP